MKNHYNGYESVSIQFCLTLIILWIAAHQVLPPMRFSKQEYWSGLPFPSPGDLPDPGTELGSPALQADSLPSQSAGKPIADRIHLHLCYYDSNCISGMKFKNNRSVSRLVLSDSQPPHGLLPTRLLCPWNSSGKNI